MYLPAKNSMNPVAAQNSGVSVSSTESAKPAKKDKTM
jgi:hypothetical protein